MKNHNIRRRGTMGYEVIPYPVYLVSLPKSFLKKFPGLKLYAYHYGPYYRWAVIEAQTGMAISMKCKTKKEAIKIALSKLIEAGPEKVAIKIKSAMKGYKFKANEVTP